METSQTNIFFLFPNERALGHHKWNIKHTYISLIEADILFRQIRYLYEISGRIIWCGINIEILLVYSELLIFSGDDLKVKCEFLSVFCFRFDSDSKSWSLNRQIVLP